MIIGSGSFCTVRVGLVTAMKHDTASIIECVGHRNVGVVFVYSVVLLVLRTFEFMYNSSQYCHTKSR